MFRLLVVALCAALATAHDQDDARYARRLRSDRYRPTVKPTAAEPNDVYRPTAQPTDRPHEIGGDTTYQPTRGSNAPISYRPGELTVRQLGLKLSTGLVE